MVGWNNPMVKGVLIGVGASLVGFAVYKHNEEKVDAFLNRFEDGMKHLQRMRR